METKNPVGRPPHEATDQTKNQVQMMAAFGNTEAQISQILGISEPTLRLHYREELDAGFVRANNAVAMNLFRQATKDDPRSFNAAKFWLNCRAGWSEYSPPPADGLPPRDVKLGKKELQQLEAERADIGTEWNALVH